MNPFELAQHLITDHFFSEELLEEIDAGQASELHTLEHNSHRWAHTHQHTANGPTPDGPKTDGPKP